jgi:competence protein ComEC
MADNVAAARAWSWTSRMPRPLGAVAAGGAGLGVTIYFELPSEPALWVGPALAAAALDQVSSRQRAPRPHGGDGPGRRLGGLRPEQLAHREFCRADAQPARFNVEGRIADIKRLPEVVRVVLEAVCPKGSGVPPIEMTPVRLRASLTNGAPPLHFGYRILVLANLSLFSTGRTGEVAISSVAWSSSASLSLGPSARAVG